MGANNRYIIFRIFNFVYERYVIVKKLKIIENLQHILFIISLILFQKPGKQKKLFISDLWSHLVFIELIQSYKKRIKIKYVKNNLLAKIL